MTLVGRIIYGTCDGNFDWSWEPRRIEAEGWDWIIARGLAVGAGPELATFEGRFVGEGKRDLVERWAIEGDH